MQAITVKFLGPTKAQGARLKASCQAKSVTLPFNYALSGNYEREWQVALEIIRKMEWDREGDILVAGNDKNVDVVFCAKHDYTTFEVIK